ncbi:dual oxidase maturation factor 1-like isoform X2 [Antedon mediterranea]|uniref:dual oxidase maturation factor 1-like isoform X2 n=1 Tax=Antedon mediterranea TaxID=105859 RepID=UPI003AF4E9F7
MATPYACESDVSECLGYDNDVIGFAVLRNKPAPTAYAANPTPVRVDVLEVGLIFAAVLLFVSYLIILPGIRGWERLWSFIRVTTSIFIGTAIMVSIYGQEWEVASLHKVETAYKSFFREEIHDAEIEVKVGLNAVNITLKTNPIQPFIDDEHAEFPNEIINYNERFHFYGSQRRNGFGPFAGRINREFRAAQWRGMPFPILWIAEYFVLDGEKIRWGRSYRHAGFYTYIMLWTAFPLWLLSNILFFMVLRYGAYFLMLTGGSLLTGNILYSSIRYGSQPLRIPFVTEDNPADGLEFHKGPHFMLCLFTGLISFIGGIIILIMDMKFPQEIATFFNVDVLQDFEDTYAEDKEAFENNGVQEHANVPDRPRFESKRKSRFAKSKRRPRTSSAGSRPRTDGVEEQGNGTASHPTSPPEKVALEEGGVSIEMTDKEAVKETTEA